MYIKQHIPEQKKIEGQEPGLGNNKRKQETEVNYSK